MSQQGICSRREADRYIEQGLVEVDGETVDKLGTKIYPHQKITLKKQAKKEQQALVTILVNKPVGYVSGQAEGRHKPAIQLVVPNNQFLSSVTEKPRFNPGMLKGLAPAGRLDIDSRGLLVLTQDGVIARQLIAADSKVETRRTILPFIISVGIKFDNIVLVRGMFQNIQYRTINFRVTTTAFFIRIRACITNTDDDKAVFHLAGIRIIST